MDSPLDIKYLHLVRTRAYLASLPDGISSYPECRCKAAVWKNILKWTDTRTLPDRIPMDPPILPDPNTLNSSWIPLVKHFVGHLVLRDCLFPTDDDIYRHFLTANRRLLSGPLYRVMFAVASPKMCVQAADRRFSKLFEGITLSAVITDAHSTRVELKYPPALMPALVGRLYLTAFEMAAQLAGGKDVTGKVISHSNTVAEYSLSWK